MTTTTEFRERLTNYYRYPRICGFQDHIAEADLDQFCSFLKTPHARQKQVYIYIHIPFCTSMCNYCPFYHTYSGHSDDATKWRFVDSVVRELEMYAQEPHFYQTPIVNINFGGGTPFVLDTAMLERILGTVFERFNVVPDPVVSMEGDPIALQDRAKLAAMKAAGLTRVSFGVQTFNERLRKKLRVQSDGIDVYKCVDAIHASGFKEWGCDMLYNCPEQNETEIRYNVDRICELGPSIVDVYDLNISPNTKLSKLVMRNRFRWNPSNRAEIAQYQAIQQTFAANGFEQVRSVNWKPANVEINRKGILHQFSEDVLAIGPSARSFLYTAGRNYRNLCSTEKYVEAVERGQYPIEAGNIVPEAVLEERDLVLFPYYLEVRKDGINYARFKSKIDDMIASGYVTETEDTVALTAAGRVWFGNVQYYFHSDDEKKAMGESMFRSLQGGRNLFNQDLVNV